MSGHPAGVALLPRGSEALYLLQRIRDEAHRFAIKAQRRKRARQVRRSALDDVPGLGPVRSAALMRAFGSVRAIREADAGQIAQVPGIGPGLAEAIRRALAEPTDAGVDSVGLGPAERADGSE